MQSEMKFYRTKHFIDQSPFDADMLQQIIPAAYVIKSRRPMGYTDSLQKAADEIGNKIYGYYRSRKHKYVLVLGKNARSDKFNVLVTIYPLSAQGWVTKAFQIIPRRKRRTLSQYLKFNHAVVMTDQDQSEHPKDKQHAQPAKPSNEYKPNHTVLSSHEWGLDIERKE